MTAYAMARLYQVDSATLWNTHSILLLRACNSRGKANFVEEVEPDDQSGEMFG